MINSFTNPNTRTTTNKKQINKNTYGTVLNQHYLQFHPHIHYAKATIHSEPKNPHKIAHYLKRARAD